MNYLVTWQATEMPFLDLLEEELDITGHLAGNF